jgi:hypothetical protein
MSLLSFQERVVLQHVFTVDVTEVRDELTTLLKLWMQLKDSPMFQLGHE